MKKIFIVVFAGMTCFYGSAQNTFPTSGNVGLGTVSPAHLLDVRGNIYTNASLIVDGGDVLIRRLSLAFGYVARPNISGYKKLQFSVEGGGPLEDLYLNADRSYFTGNVGIGISSPVNKLHVVGGNIAAATDNTPSGFVQLWNDNAIIWKNGNTNGGLRFGSATDFGAGNWSEKMRITDGGNVGFGVAHPEAKLDIQAAAHNDGILVRSNNGFVKFHSSVLGPGSWNGMTQPGDGGIIYGTAGQPNAGTNANFGFVIAPWFNGTAGFRMDKDGNVGIGTSLPQAKLAVNGDVFAKKVKVTQTGWPDYVFEKEYHLPSLREVEQFIHQNKHLPDVPSAKEVETNGLDLGENQSTLLKKIEELTMYIIQQQKRIEEMELKNKMIEELENKIIAIEKMLKK